MALCSVRSERACCEKLAYNLPCRWFLDMDLMERSFDATVFTRNRLRLPAHDAGRALFDEVVWAADGKGLLLDEHVSVDGPLIEAAASRKSFRSKEGPPPQRDACRHHGPRGVPAAQGAEPGGPAGLPWPCPEGKPPWPADGLHGQSSHRHGQAGCGTGTPGRAPGTGLPPARAGSRPRLRHQGMCAGHPGTTGTLLVARV